MYKLESIADSPSASYEITLVGSSILTWQGHPELSRDDVMTKIFPAITAAGRLQGEEAERAKRGIEEDKLDDDLLLEFGKLFIRGAY